MTKKTYIQRYSAKKKLESQLSPKCLATPRMHGQYFYTNEEKR